MAPFLPMTSLYPRPCWAAMDILLSHFFCHSRKYFYIRDSMRQGSITYGISYRPATPNISRADVAGGSIKSLSCAVIEPTIFFETLPLTSLSANVRRRWGMVKIPQCMEESRSSMMDVEDENNQMRAPSRSCCHA